MIDIEICSECGQELEEKLIRKGGTHKRRIVRLTCSCGFETSKEGSLEYIKRINQKKK